MHGCTGDGMAGFTAFTRYTVHARHGAIALNLEPAHAAWGACARVVTVQDVSLSLLSVPFTV